MQKLMLIFLIAFSTGMASGQELLVNISKFGWMSGCWERVDKAKSLLISENWMRPAGTSMLGTGRTVRNDVTVDYEFMRIEIRGMDYYFVAQPKSNEAETAFKLTSSQPNSAVFEDPTHDFPQRISYRLTTPDKLDARIEGTRNGKVSGMDFPFVRAKCT
jgi:hypothetical protein